MKILLALFLCASCVLCHPVEDTKTPRKDVLVKDKVLNANPSDNDIPLNGGEATVVVTEQAETTTKTLLSDLEKKGEKLLEDILSKITNEMDVKVTDNDTNSQTENVSEKPKDSSFSVTADVSDLKLDPNSEITEIKPAGVELIKPVTEKNEDFGLSNFDGSSKPDLLENPEDSVFGIVPLDNEQTETTFIVPKLDRNVYQLEIENKQNENKDKLVEIPLEIQKPNQEDRLLPDVDIQDTGLLDDSTFSNPILSPYDTLPLPDSAVFENKNINDETVLPFSLSEGQENVPFESEQTSENENNIKNPFENDIPHDYDYGQDYNQYAERPTNNYFDYDYDFPERNLPVPVHNQMTMMNSHYMTNHPFQQPNSMGNNQFTIMNNPLTEYKATLNGNEPINDFKIQLPPQKNEQKQKKVPKIPYKEVSLLMDQIFPGIFSEVSAIEPQKEITIFVEGNPEILRKAFEPLNGEKKLPLPVNFNKPNEDFTFEIGNMHPSPNRFPTKETNRFNNFPVETISYNSPFSMMQKQALMMPNPFTEVRIDSIGITPVKEIDIDEEEDNVQSNTNKNIEDIIQQNKEMDPMMNDYGYGSRTYAPRFQHALYMHPEEYRYRYPNRQYMSNPYFDELPTPVYYDNEGQRYNFPYRNRMSFPESAGEPTMNYNNPQNFYDHRNSMGNNFNRFSAPNQDYINGMRNNFRGFAPPDQYFMNNNNRFNSPNRYEAMPNF